MRRSARRIARLLRGARHRLGAEARLRASEVRLRALTAHASDMLLVTDAAARVTFWSASAEAQLGWRGDEILGREIYDFLPEHDRATVVASVEAFTAAPGAIVRAVHRVHHRDGTTRLVEAVAHNLLHEPAVGGIVSNLRDITEQELLSQQLIAAEKVEIVGRLAGGVAHDFNNLLTAILGSAEAMQEDLERGVAPSLEDIAIVRAAGERAQQLTAQLLAFARRQLITPVPLHLGAHLQRRAATLRTVVGARIRLHLEVAEDLWTVHADPGQIDQLVMSLAVHARDAMPDGGTLALEVRNATVAAQGEVPVAWVQLVVRDESAGLDPEHLPHVFEPFFTTRVFGRGAGLGLASVDGIARQAGGHVTVESAPGRGTTFVVSLPRFVGG